MESWQATLLAHPWQSPDGSSSTTTRTTRISASVKVNVDYKCLWSERKGHLIQRTYLKLRAEGNQELLEVWSDLQEVRHVCSVGRWASPACGYARRFYDALILVWTGVLCSQWGFTSRADVIECWLFSVPSVTTLLRWGARDPVRMGLGLWSVIRRGGMHLVVFIPKGD